MQATENAWESLRYAETYNEFAAPRRRTEQKAGSQYSFNWYTAGAWSMALRQPENNPVFPERGAAWRYQY